MSIISEWQDLGRFFFYTSFYLSVLIEIFLSAGITFIQKGGLVITSFIGRVLDFSK